MLGTSRFMAIVYFGCAFEYKSRWRAHGPGSMNHGITYCHISFSSDVQPLLPIAVQPPQITSLYENCIQPSEIHHCQECLFVCERERERERDATDCL